jgi:thiamine biosynthesis lipoprotein
MKPKRIIYFLIFLLLLITSCTNVEQNNFLEINGSTMGTTYSVKVVIDQSTAQLNEIVLKEKIDSVLVEVNRQMSTYIPTSEISVFNNLESNKWFEISEDFAFVLYESIDICKLSSGSLDITVGPLVNIWGFGPDQRPRKIPSQTEIDSAMQLVGIQNLNVKLEPPSVMKGIANLEIDLSSTAKGFGVDKVFALLNELGYKNSMVEIGGEVRTSGLNHKNEKWKIGISEADHSGAINKVVQLSDLSMATSGDYWNYFEENGIRYSHTIDPRTGKPISHKLASITVFDSTCLRADGFATALYVMGPEKAYDFAVEMELPVYMIVKKDTGFGTVKSPKFIELFEK